MRTVFSAKKRVSSVPETIEIGGTSASTAQAALTALEGIASSQLDVPDGVAVLDSNELVKPENIPPLFAPIEPMVVIPSTSIEVGQKIDCVVTNYDSQREYVFGNAFSGHAILHSYDDMINQLETAEIYNVNSSVTPGVVTSSSHPNIKNPGTIVYTAPGVAGPGGFVLNGKLFSIDIVQPYMGPPVINYPLNNAVITTSTITIDATFGDYYGDISKLYDGFRRFNYELSDDINFTNIIAQDTIDYTQINITIPDLLDNKLYYIRIRNTGWRTVDGGSLVLLPWSEWSTTRSFATDIPPLFQEIQIVTDANEVNYEEMGTAVHLSQDGTLLAVGQIGKEPFRYSSVRGSVVIYNKQPDNTFVLNAELFSPIALGQVMFGSALTMSADKTTLFTSAPNGRFDFSADGKVYAYRCTTPGDWTTAAIAYEILPPIPTQHQRFGADLKCVKQANVLGVSDDLFQLHIFSFSDTAATLQTTITPPVLPNEFFGSSFDFSANGQRLIVGAQESFHTLHLSGWAIECGAVYVYDYNGTTWNLTASLFPDAPDNGSLAGRRFGSQVAISPDGTEIIVCQDYGSNPFKFLSAFKLIDNTWVKTQEFLPSAWLSNFTSPLDIAFSADGNQFAVSSGNTYDCITIYAKQDNTWTEVQTLKASDDPDGNQRFGESFGLSGDGTILASGAADRDGLVTYSSGGVYIYKK